METGLARAKTRFGHVVTMQTGSSTLSSGAPSRGSLLAGLFRRQIRFAAGVAILVGLVLAVAALATWTVSDPSFSNANGATPSNALGYGGAAFADLVMQFFGLAGVIGLLPALFWAVGLMRNRPVDRMSRRGAAWFGGAWLTAAVFGLMPSSQGWPLPNGLGGVLGDMALKVPAVLIGGFPSGIVAVILGLLLMPPSLWLLGFGAGLIGRETIAETDEADTDADQTGDDEPVSRAALLFGAITHGWYTLRGRFRRLVGFAPVRGGRPLPEEPLDFNRDFDQTDTTVGADQASFGAERIEPGFESGSGFRPAPAAADAPPFDLDDTPLPGGVLSADRDAEEDPAADWREQPVPARTASLTRPAGNSPRIAAPADRPKPGARVQRDAQGSMLEEHGFSLPSVHLLNEAKNVVKDASLSPEALEQNARMLEGVLEDFGVQGRNHPCAPRPGGDALRAGAGARHQVVPRDRAGRRYRPFDERDRRARRRGSRPQRHRHRTAECSAAKRSICAN
jgi:S-DNA-T family DNA segregation ATPase FtsK/SpoIIIE